MLTGSREEYLTGRSGSALFQTSPNIFFKMLTQGAVTLKAGGIFEYLLTFIGMTGPSSSDNEPLLQIARLANYVLANGALHAFVIRPVDIRLHDPIAHCIMCRRETFLAPPPLKLSHCSRM